jgi:hypothetical protein
VRGRFAWRRNRHDRKTYARGTKLAIGALQSARGRLGQKRNRPQGKDYGDAVGLGIGVLAIAAFVVLLFWLARRMLRETAPTPTPEEGVEDAPPGSGTAPPGPPSAEDVSPGEEPPPGEERPGTREP